MFHLNFPTVSFIYLIIVVLQSLTGDFVSSAAVSVLAFLCLNFFFVPPIFSLAVSDSSDTLALISFLVTGLVVTRLTSRAREAADSAAIQRAETTRLYELAQELLASDPIVTIGIDVLKPFKSRFGLGAVCLFDAITAQLQLDGESLNDLAEKTRTAYISRSNFQDCDSGVAVRLLLNGDQVIGAIGFEGLQDLELTAEPLAALAAVMMERTRAFQRASHAAAATEAEMFRGAVLDAEKARTGNGMQVPTDAPFSGESWPQPEKNKAAMIARLDGYIGQLLEQLQKLGMTNNTVIFFTSDTGPQMNGGVGPKFFQSAGPFRGSRGDLYDGGLRVPMIAHWPGKIPAGQVSDFPCAAWDFLPTATDIALIQSPTNIDGISILTTLFNQIQTNRHESLYWKLQSRNEAQAVRRGDWKVMRSKADAPLELYNLKTDPGETNNVAGKNPDVIKKFERLLKAN